MSVALEHSWVGMVTPYKARPSLNGPIGRHSCKASTEIKHALLFAHKLESLPQGLPLSWYTKIRD